MKTNQVMESTDRELCGVIVRQRTKDSFLSLDDILQIVTLARQQSGKKVFGFNFSNWIGLDSTQEFLDELRCEIKTEPYIKGAKNRSGWIHPFFAIKILTHFNPKFEVQVYKWLWDFLVKNRIDSGDSNIRMRGSLYSYARSKRNFQTQIRMLSQNIKAFFGVESWNSATQEQLKARDELQVNIADVVNTIKDSKQGIRFACDMYAANHNLDSEAFKKAIIPFYGKE